MIVIDTETRLFKPGCMAPKIVCLSWDNGSNNGIIKAADIDSFLIPILENKNATLVGHNIAYDMACLLEHHPKLSELIWDAYDNLRIQCTKCREKLLAIAKGTVNKGSKFSLAMIMKKRFGITLEKDEWRLRYSELENIPLNDWPKGAINYSINDSVSCRKIAIEQMTDAEDFDYEMFETEAARQSCYSFALQLTSCRGIQIDKIRINNLVHKMMPQLNTLRTKLFNLGIMFKNKAGKLTKRTKIIRELIIQHHPNIDEVPRTPKTNQVKADRKVLKECKHPDLDLLLRYTKLEKVNSTYAQKFKNAKDKPIHPSYDSIKETGRVSSFNPNIQNQPRKSGIRECIQARPGNVFIFCDYDSQEMRTLAQVCYTLLCYSTLRDKYLDNPDFDPHIFFAAQLMDIDEREALVLKKAGDKKMLERRQQAKAANFGFPGGLGADAFRAYAEGYGLKLTLEEADNLRNDWFNRWPEMRDYFNLISNITSYGTGTIAQLVSGRIRGGCSYTQAANTYFQGLASDASKAALYAVAKKCFTGDSDLLGYRPVVFVHDEIGIEGPEQRMMAAAKELETTMISAMEEICEDVPARATAIISRRWSKNAKETRNKKGEVVPWDG